MKVGLIGLNHAVKKDRKKTLGINDPGRENIKTDKRRK
jgi:hypothetical protein